MNTISPAPPLKALPRSRRVLGILLGLTGAATTNLALGYLGFSYYTRSTTFVPFDGSSADLSTATFQRHNPHGNAPACIDHAVKTVPLARLRETDTRKLTTEFCRSVWSGPGYAIQRRILEKKYRALEGREKQLWSREELGKSEYKVGEVITDHFEVVEHADDKVIVRCGDTPLNAGPRPDDGLFSMEVTKDEEAQTATFHLKSVFVNTTPEGKTSGPMSWSMLYLHQLYTKLWMETATRKLLK